MTPEMFKIWLRMVFAGPAIMNPWFQFWLNSAATTEELRAMERKTKP